MARDKIHNEIKFGGTEPPCPLCGLPRLRRSDYIRCGSCGVNWIDGIDTILDKHPAIERMRKFIEETKATTIKKVKDQGDEKATTR